jgi:hypothetical protein
LVAQHNSAATPKGSHGKEVRGDGIELVRKRWFDAPDFGLNHPSIGIDEFQKHPRAFFGTAWRVPKMGGLLGGPEND